MEKNRTPRKGRLMKVGLTLTVVSVFAVAMGIGTWAAFSDTTKNSANSFQAGTVSLNGSHSTALYDATTSATKPGDSDEGCVKVIQAGSLASTVKVYLEDALSVNALDDNVQLEI